LNKLNTPSVNIITVEDPVEFDVSGINQVQINAAAGISFAAGLRSILRQDPDIVMVGEIRDAETAETAFQAAQTGHLVLSTLHTNDAPSAITRLLDLGVDDFQISSALISVIGQRLVRKVHQECKVRDEPSVKTLERIQPFLKKEGEPVFWKGSGCDTCKNTGYFGRTGLYELFTVTPSIRDSIKPGVSAMSLKKTAQKEGFQTMAIDGITKALQGLTSLEEVFRVAPPEIDTGTQGVAKPAYSSQPAFKGSLADKPIDGRSVTSNKAAPKPSEIKDAPAFTDARQKDKTGRPVKVLVVDDEEITRTILCEALKTENYETITAKDGIDALERVKEDKPDLIVTDYIMPQMNGLELVKILKADKGTSNIPILMLTQMDDVQSEITVMKSGAEEYLTKPIDSERFLIRVESLLRRMR